MKERTSRHLKEPGLSELGVHASLPDLIFGHIYAQSSIPSPTPEGAPPRTDAHPLPPIVPAPAPGKDFRGGQGAASLLPPADEEGELEDVWMLLWLSVGLS